MMAVTSHVFTCERTDSLSLNLKTVSKSRDRGKGNNSDKHFIIFLRGLPALGLISKSRLVREKNQ